MFAFSLSVCARVNTAASSFGVVGVGVDVIVVVRFEVELLRLVRSAERRAKLAGAKTAKKKQTKKLFSAGRAPN